MSQSISHKAVQLAPSGIRRFFEVANEIPDVISLGVGEPDFMTPMPIRQAAMQCIREGKTYYTANAGLMELRQAISQYIDVKHDLHYDPRSEIVVTVGGSEAIDMVCRAIINPGDEVICIDPSYVSYAPSIKLADGVVVPVTLRADRNFILTPEDLEAAITPQTKAMIINFPNNPTGASMTKEELAALVPVIEAHDLYVITDEIYSELNYNQEHLVSIAAFPGMKERTIYINGFSKSFAMTGWRLGYACAPHEIMEQMIKIHQFTIMAAPTISQYAGIVALRDCDHDVQVMRQSYQQRRNFLMARFKDMGLPCFEPQGAFYTFPDISEFGLSSEEFALKLLDEEKLAVVPGSAFGEGGEGHIRISYAYSLNELEAAVEKLNHFIQKLRQD